MTKVKEILLVGGGGHCRSCIDVIESLPEYKIVGIIDAAKKLGQQVFSYTVIGTDADLTSLREKYDYAFLTLGQIHNNELRQKLFAKLLKLNFVLPSIVSQSAYVSKHAELGVGTIVMHKAIVNAGARIGDNVIVNTRALIEHDSTVGNHCHIATSATVNGDVNIQDNVFVGSNACIVQGVKLASHLVIGANATVTKDLKKSGTYVGSPCKRIS